MSQKSLEDLLQSAGNPVTLLRNSQTGPYVYPVVPPEYSNWRDEQRSWRESCILFNQSFHMTDMYVEGPDAPKLLEKLGVNTFKNFGPMKAKQYVPCNYDGYVIGDVVLFHLEQGRYNLVGRPSVHNWVTYHAQTGGYNVKLDRDERTVARTDGKAERKQYRFQVQGPNALKVVERATGKPVPDVKFFQMTEFTIAGKRVLALRHGMAGAPGFELFGPWADGEAVRQALIDAGKDFGLKLSGARTYSSNTLESGWIPSPMPAIYSGEKMKPYRQWLKSTDYEGILSLGGSFLADNIEDYYLTPWDLGYGPIVKFDHDFIGREALETLAKNPPRRQKVTLELNSDDVVKCIDSQFNREGERAKFFEFPSAVYATLPYDRVAKDGKTIGISTWCGYSSNERRMLTLAVIDAAHAQPGTQVTFVWGEENGGTSKPTVERHKQMEIRATVAPVPYSDPARKDYRAN
jgi:syringate O-demethylase